MLNEVLSCQKPSSVSISNRGFPFNLLRVTKGSGSSQRELPRRDGQGRDHPEGEGGREEGEVQDQPVQLAGVGDDLAQQIPHRRPVISVSPTI